MMTDRRFHQLADEHRVLIAHHGKVQNRCSELIARQVQEIETSQGEIMRLRAEVIRRDTQIAILLAEREELERTIPGLPRRRALARQVGLLIERVQALLRERNVGVSSSVNAPSTQLKQATMTSNLANRSVLCLGQDESAVRFMMRMVGMAGERFDHDPVADTDDLTRIEQSVRAADLVICQAGCISQDAYWRVRDHCRRTGKPCLLVEHPKAFSEPKG